MARLEDKIRDYLAGHLELIEQNLALVSTEYALSHSTGAGGRIDIVAKDRFGHFVVIEIKRSDQAARHALNEIHKYTALFRLKLGLGEKQVRLMVVSTDWHELLLPLSEFAISTQYSVEGYKIVADNNGLISSTRRVQLDEAVGNAGTLSVSPCQGVYLFEDLGKRDAFSKTLPDHVVRSGVTDFVLINCNYQGRNQGVIYPYGVYLCFSSPLIGASLGLLRQIKASIPWEDGLDEPDENFHCAINEYAPRIWDSYETGYPEKLTNIQREWNLSIVKRFGRFEINHLISDTEIVGLAQATSGGSNFYFGKVSSPRFTSEWADFCKNITPVLSGYMQWQKTIPKLLREIRTHAPQAVVTASIYGPANLLISLYAIGAGRNFTRCPHLEIVIEDSKSKCVRFLLGFLVWNGRRINQTPSMIIRGLYGDLFGWAMANQFGATFEREAAALAAHNLQAVIVEWRFQRDSESGPHELGLKNGRLVRGNPSEWAYNSIYEFAEFNKTYLSQLVTEFEGFSHGIRDSVLGSEERPHSR